MLALNALWYAVLMRGFYERPHGSWVSVARDDPSIAIILTSFLSLATLMNVAYPHFRFSESKWLNGLAVGVLVGLIYALPTTLYYFGTTDILAGDVAALDVAWHMIEEGTAGLVVAAILPASLRGPVEGREPWA